MKICHYIIILIALFSISSCHNQTKENSKSKKTETVSTDLQVDHFNIWTNNPKKAKNRLIEIGFSSVPDSLSAIHQGQGTAGRYFYFLNNYLELIFVYNQKELEENNRINKELDFTERANFNKNEASPFSIALKVNDYDIEKIPFEKVKYHQDWMEENGNIYAAKSSKINLGEPSVLVVYPQLESDKFENLSDVEKIPDEYAFAREFYKHPNGAQKVTEIIITSSSLDVNSETIRTVNGIENLTVKNGKEHLMELHFDYDIQGKSFDLRPDLPLIIYL